MKRKGIGKLLVAGAAIGTALWAMHEHNKDFEFTNIEILTDKTDDPIRMIHLSDLHTKSFGRNNQELVNGIESQEPDIICITGDLADHKKTLPETYVINLINTLTNVAPVFFVTGNHEFRAGRQKELKKQIGELGATVLEGDTKEITIKDSTLFISGIDDIRYTDTDLDAVLSELADKDGFKLFLSHRPGYMDIYSSYDIDLVLCGHNHGGQVRLPWVGGLFRPEMGGFFPKYQQGLYTENNTNMVVSRGLGIGYIPVRAFNKPEIVVVDLIPDKKGKTEPAD